VRAAVNNFNVFFILEHEKERKPSLDAAHCLHGQDLMAVLFP
jgi:hypothetical protein